METPIIDLIFQTLAGLLAQYPDAAWIGTVLAVLMSICGICAVATIWMPVPGATTGLYATVYALVHALAAHFGQNKGAVADGKSAEVQDAVKAVKGK